MKLVTYNAGGEQRVGAVVGDGNNQVVDLAAADRALARREKRKTHAFFSDMLTLLEAGSKGISAAKKAAASGASVKPLSKVRLKAPVPNPRKGFCLAGNYQDHIEEGGGKIALQDKETPRVFMKPPTTTVIGQNAKILIPPVARSIDWEGELAVVIGRKAKGVKTKQALNYVAGYTIMNDVSERKLVIKKRSQSRDRDQWFDWLNGKWLDTFGPQGPWIVTRDEIPDPQKLDISTFITVSYTHLRAHET